jgi:hypothetical protein
MRREKWGIVVPIPENVSVRTEETALRRELHVFGRGEAALFDMYKLFKETSEECERKIREGSG